MATGGTPTTAYCVIVAVLMFLVALWHVRSKAGRAWAAIRQSQPTAIAAGVNTTLYKLWAFALASFMAGVAGGLLAAATGGSQRQSVPDPGLDHPPCRRPDGRHLQHLGRDRRRASLRLLPALLDDWGISTELLTILFGVGVLQVLLTAPGGLIDQVPRDVGKLRRAIGRLFAGCRTVATGHRRDRGRGSDRCASAACFRSTA